MSSPPNPNDLTRHQLDELDALLQRMLSLPLSAATPATPAWRADAAAAKPTPHLNEAVPRPQLAAVAAPKLAPPAVEVVAEPEPMTPSLFGPPDDEPVMLASPSMAVPVAEPATGLSAAEFVVPAAMPPRTLRGVDAPALPAGFRTNPPLPSTLPAPVNLIVAPPESDEADEVPVVLWPLYAVNRLIEGVVGMVPLGSLVLRPAAKNLCALAGVAMLCGAAAWAAQGMGYLKLPLPR